MSTKAVREERRKRAEERNAEYNKLTTQQKLDRLPPEPHAARQRAKLLNQLEQEKQKTEAAKVAASEKKNNKKGDNQ